MTPPKPTRSSPSSWASGSSLGRSSSRPRPARCATLTSEPAVQDVRIGGRRIEIAPHNCFACGTLNVHGLHLELHAGDDRCWVELSLPERFQGWDDIAHGGIVCTILDEVMAWALIDHDMWGVTARLNVDFRRPVPIGRRIRGEGRVRET